MQTAPKYGTPGVIGIRREDKSKWERRVSITPAHVAELLAKYPRLKFIVQPSDKRVFRDNEYRRAGARIQEDLSECSVIFGVKEVAISSLIPNRTYVFFSHVIKAQEYNMPLLDQILEKNIRLIDYEKITDKDGKRLVAFGKFAGNAAALDFLFGMGKYFLNLGYSTPFLNISNSYTHKTLEKAKQAVKDIAELIEDGGLPQEYCPLIIGITGKGRSAQGTMEILECLPIKKVDPDQLEALVADKENPEHKSVVYVTNIDLQHMVKPARPDVPFNKQDYYAKPEDYVPIFHEKYLPYISILFHCIYWETKYQKLITAQQIKELAERKNLRLLGISDITCDLEGSIDFLKFFTTIDEPFFLYDPLTGETSRDIAKSSHEILYQAVENLPAELAYDASVHFANKLFPFIENIANSDITLPLEQQKLMPEIERAVITWNGKLTKPFQYIMELRKKNELKKRKEKINQKSPVKRDQASVELKLVGHLFDTKAINQIFDYLEKSNVNFRVVDMNIGQNNIQSSSVDIQVCARDQNGINRVMESIYDLGKKCDLSIEG